MNVLRVFYCNFVFPTVFRIYVEKLNFLDGREWLLSHQYLVANSIGTSFRLNRYCFGVLLDVNGLC